jgi:hypothetical protein
MTTLLPNTRQIFVRPRLAAARCLPESACASPRIRCSTMHSAARRDRPDRPGARRGRRNNGSDAGIVAPHSAKIVTRALSKLRERGADKLGAANNRCGSMLPLLKTGHTDIAPSCRWSPARMVREGKPQ